MGQKKEESSRQFWKEPSRASGSSFSDLELAFTSLDIQWVHRIALYLKGDGRKRRAGVSHGGGDQTLEKAHVYVVTVVRLLPQTEELRFGAKLQVITCMTVWRLVSDAGCVHTRKSAWRMSS